MIELFILQGAAHLLADFTFQPQKWCDKKEGKMLSKEHFYHVLPVFVFSWLLSLQVSFWWAALLIAASHLLIDVLKSCLYKRNIGRKYLFFADQTVHIIAIGVVVYLFSQKTNIAFPIEITTNVAFGLFALIFCTKPANIFIKKFMEMRDIIRKSKDESELLRAGRIIGSLERLISFVLILFGQFAAVGFIIAAKSILRFRDTQTAKTEYLLIGTLLSFGIAFFLGIIYKII
jgi:hypothetical protein